MYLRNTIHSVYVHSCAISAKLSHKDLQQAYYQPLEPVEHFVRLCSNLAGVI